MTLYVKYSQGQKVDYSGGITKESIIKWFNKKISPPYLEVDCDTMITRVSEAKLAISLFGTYRGELYYAFMKVSRNPEINEIYSFFHTKDAACASKFG